MNEKTKKIIIIVFTAIASLIASVAAVCLGVPLEDLLPKDIAPTALAPDTNPTTCVSQCYADTSSSLDSFSVSFH